MKPAKRINLLLNLQAKHPYYSKGGTWFHRLKKFPAVLIDAGGYIHFATEETYRAYPGIRISATHDNQVHVTKGISSLPGYRPFSDAELALLFIDDSELLNLAKAPTDEKALRKKRQIDAIVRNQQFVDDLKKLYRHTCQLCNERIQVRPGKYYCEVHHLKPLGQPHSGPDTKANMLCVCPNHHTLLDFFAIPLNLSELTSQKHAIDENYVAYHNERHAHFNPA
jgi:5-methylcytosine-specific restriction protein A